MHIKDGPAEFNQNLISDNPDPMTPLGKGTLNLPAIFESAPAGCEWFVLEMDTSAIDVYDALKQSIEYMKLVTSY